MKKELFAFCFLLMLFAACRKNVGGDLTGNGSPVIPPAAGGTDTVPSIATVRSWLVDENATAETGALFYKLKKISKTNILFGHQDDTKRGYGWANEQGQPYTPLRSDVKDVTGSYPAVYGWDFAFIAGFSAGAWFDYENLRSKDLAIDAYNRGGINTFSWHYNNPVSKGSFYWSESPVNAVTAILPGGTAHLQYTTDLAKIAAFAGSLTGADGKLVPVIFRPFHEFDGDWFWWGAAHCSPEQYKQLYQFTITYLRDSLQVRNFLYAWSPDKNYTSQTTLLARYPGDAYVDIVGSDNYGDMGTGTPVAIASGKLKILSDYAKASNKVAALTETGLDKIPQATWFTSQLLGALTNQQVELAYVLTWANRTDSYWTPYAGHAAASDFLLFRNSSYVMFGSETPEMYKLQ